MGQMTITFKISSFDFAFIWSLYIKEGGAFNEFLVDYYIEQIAEKFPEADMVVPKLFLTMGNLYSLLKLLCPSKVGGFSFNAQKLKEEFFVSGKEIRNPIEVGI